MKSFLNIVAADMLSHFTNDMRDVTVVFPSKRAGMFLSREFATLSPKPVWAPHYCTMGELFQSLTPIQLADPLECVFHLYCVMQEVLGAEYSETLDDFWSWGEVLMADFDDIDKHLSNAKAIFTNIADHERLRTLDYLDERQRETLERFFGTFSLKRSTGLQEKFLRTWDRMFDIYTLLHERLLSQGKLWEGALFRHVVEQMKSDESLVEKLTQGRRAVCFAGFNVLGTAEHTLMSLVQREGKARFYWDYDIYYCHPKSDNEAGYFMRKNLQDFPSAIEDTEAFDNFSHLSDVTFIASTTDNAAARYVGTWSTASPGTSSAVILCNESLMQPVLHAIPDTEGEVNVTMGFPVSDTPVFGIVMALLKLQIEGYDAERKRFRFPFVKALQRQPFYELLAEEDCLAYHAGSTVELLDWLVGHLRRIALHYAQIEKPNLYEQLYSETVFRTDRMLCLLRELVGSGWPASPLLLRRLLRQMMASTKIPFHSEPDRGLQVMGVLETRCLDFENILLLSAEEGSLPRSASANSFIPESLREAFGMTTWRHRICVYAYYFYRLVQRSRHLTCIYNENCSGGTQHEMSRFLRQMLAETAIPIRTLWLQSEPRLKSVPPLQVEKTPEVMALLRERYDQSIEGGKRITLSPSAINSYMKCPMQFYLGSVLRIRQDDDPEEGISASLIGDIFHDTAKFFYEWIQERYGTDLITADMLREPKVLVPMLDAAFDVCRFNPTDAFDRLPELRLRFEGKAPSQPPPRGRSVMPPHPSQVLPLHGGVRGGLGELHYKGTDLIAHDVILRYLQELVRYDASHAPFRIVGTEVERTLDVEVAGVKLKVGGRIDRIDEMGGRLRIVDYKTGSHVPEKVKMENVVGLNTRHEDYYLQTFIYALASVQGDETGPSPLPAPPLGECLLRKGRRL